jgi:chorismate lyase/3-hydroxybenzoate synthase
MTIQGSRSRELPIDQPGTLSLPPGLPAWIADQGIHLRAVTTHFDGARGMDILTFQQRVVEAYRTVIAQLESTSPSHPVRFWAFVPGIHDDLGAGLDRYMAFNAGRYGAFSTRFGPETASGRSVPTASAVGVAGDQFVLYGLAADEPGLPIENPRQVPAYRYSRRFGPMPPCFSRATLLARPTHEPVLIVGGTASITGEESQHVGDLHRQANETFRNLASVVASAAGAKFPEGTPSSALAPLLATFRDIRVYHPRAEDGPAIAALVRANFSSSCRVEVLQASLCRPELLIEIEGVAAPPRRLANGSLNPARES